MIKAIIFDLDGVIVHTDHFHYLAWKQLADSLGMVFDEKTNDELRGVSRMESLNIILRNNQVKLTTEQKERLADQKNDLYRLSLSTLKPSDIDSKVVSTLLELKRQGYLLAIGSSSKNAKYILQQTQLLHLFDVISDGTNITKSKPDPEVFLTAAVWLNVNPESCLVVEDAIAGIDAAKQAKMKACGIGPASRYNVSDFNIKHFSDLLTLMQNE